MPQRRQILYCRCAKADVIDPDTRQDVLTALVESGLSFRAVTDLCGLAANGDAALVPAESPLTIIACHARAVVALLERLGQAPAGRVEVLNMRTTAPADVAAALARIAEQERQEVAP